MPALSVVQFDNVLRLMFSLDTTPSNDCEQSVCVCGGVCGVCCTVGGSSVGFLARGRLTQRHSWAHVGLAQQVEIGSDQEFEAQTITDTYHFDERGTVFRSRQRKEWCSIKTGCHRTGCSCPVLMHDISSDPNDKYPTPPPSI